MLKRIIIIDGLVHELMCEVKEEGGTHTAYFASTNTLGDKLKLGGYKPDTEVEIVYDDLIFCGKLKQSMPTTDHSSFLCWTLKDVTTTANGEFQANAEKSLDHFLEVMDEAQQEARQRLLDAFKEAFGDTEGATMDKYLEQAVNHLVVELQAEDDNGKRTIYVKAGQQVAYGYFDKPSPLGYFTYINPSAPLDDLAEVMWFCFEHREDDHLQEAEAFALEVMAQHKREGMAYNAAQHQFVNAFAAYLNVKIDDAV